MKKQNEKFLYIQRLEAAKIICRHYRSNLFVESIEGVEEVGTCQCQYHQNQHQAGKVKCNGNLLACELDAEGIANEVIELQNQVNKLVEQK